MRGEQEEYNCRVKELGKLSTMPRQISMTLREIRSKAVKAQSPRECFEYEAARSRSQAPLDIPRLPSKGKVKKPRDSGIRGRGSTGRRKCQTLTGQGQGQAMKAASTCRMGSSCPDSEKEDRTPELLPLTLYFATPGSLRRLLSER